MPALSDKIRLILKLRGMTTADLACRLGYTRPNIALKLNCGKLTEADIAAIAEALDCKFEAVFTLNDTGRAI